MKVGRTISRVSQMILEYLYVKNISIHYQSLNNTFKKVIVEKKLKEY